MAGGLALLLALLAAGAVIGSSAEAAEALGWGAEPDEGSPGRAAGAARPRHLRLQPFPGRCGQTSPFSPAGRPLLSPYGLDASVSTEVEFGVCTVTCGIGIREVLLTSGCPGTETGYIIRVEECQAAVDCGWGIPISEGLACVKMPCIYIPPENRFKYVWKMLIPNKTAHILPNDLAITDVCRDTHSVTFQCETQENGNIVASIKYTVHAKTEMRTGKPKKIETEQSRRTTTDTILGFCLVTGIIVTVGVIFPMIFMSLHC